MRTTYHLLPFPMPMALPKKVHVFKIQFEFYDVLFQKPVYPLVYSLGSCL